MLIITANYSDKNNKIKLSREVADDAHIGMIIGEILYGVEVQVPEMFDTKDKFENTDIPEEFKKNATILNTQTDKYSLQITIVRRNTRK